MESIVDVISSLGFPIAIAVYALWSSKEHEKYLQTVLDTTIKENTKAVERLADLIEGGLMLVRNGNLKGDTKK